MIGRLNRDLSFWAALLAGPFVWGLLAFDQAAAPDLLWPLQSPQSLLLPVLVYPVLEEMAFRGWLQGWLWRYPGGRVQIGSISVANLLTSTLFAGSHLLHHPPFWALAIFVPSLVFGYFRDKYQRVVPSIILHSVYNLVWFSA